MPPRFIAVLDTLGPFDLIEVARGVVVDGRPEQAAQIAYVARGGGSTGRANVLNLLWGSGLKVGVKSLAHHFGGRRCGEVKRRSEHGVPAYHGVLAARHMRLRRADLPSVAHAPAARSAGSLTLVAHIGIVCDQSRWTAVSSLRSG